MIRTIKDILAIDGVNQNEHCSGKELVASTGNVFSILTIGLDYEPMLGAPVVWDFGGSHLFEGFVYEVSGGPETWKVVCRSDAARLDEPFVSRDDTVDEATTSHELCALYTAKTGVPITDTAGDLQFDGSYRRSGTYATGLRNIAAVLGSDIYPLGAGVVIEPAKPQGDSGLVIEDYDVVEKPPVTTSLYNRGVGFVTISNTTDTADGGAIVADNHIHAELDECVGDVLVFVSPGDTVDSAHGITILPDSVSVRRTETFDLVDQDYIKLAAKVASIEAIKLNGVDVLPQSVDYNVVTFVQPLRGTLDVVYYAQGHRAKANVKSTPKGRFVSFDLYYADQILTYVGFLRSTCGVDGSGSSIVDTDGNYIECWSPRSPNYVDGFDFYTFGALCSAKIYIDGADSGDWGISGAQATFRGKEEGEVSLRDDGKYEFRVRYTLDTAITAKSYGRDIVFTVDNAANSFVFDDYYPKVTVTYDTDNAYKYHVQHADVAGKEVIMSVFGPTCEIVCSDQIYGLSDEPVTPNGDGDKLPCEYPADIKVDLVSQLNLPDASDIAGRDIVIVDDAGGTSVTQTISNDGIVTVHITHDGEYILETAPLKKRSKVVIRANVNGTL